MSCTKNAALQQCCRLRGLDFYPRDREPQLELIRAIEQTAADDEDAERIVSEWINGNSIAPKPSHIRSLRKVPDADIESLPPVPSPRKSGFIGRGDEHLDPNWQAFASELGLPTTAEFYAAWWHEPAFAVERFGELISSWRWMTDSERFRASEALRSNEKKVTT